MASSCSLCAGTRSPAEFISRYMNAVKAYRRNPKFASILPRLDASLQKVATNYLNRHFNPQYPYYCMNFVEAFRPFYEALGGKMRVKPYATMGADDMLVYLEPSLFKTESADTNPALIDVRDFYIECREAIWQSMKCFGTFMGPVGYSPNAAFGASIVRRLVSSEAQSVIIFTKHVSFTSETFTQRHYVKFIEMPNLVATDYVGSRFEEVAKIYQTSVLEESQFRESSHRDCLLLKPAISPDDVAKACSSNGLILSDASGSRLEQVDVIIPGPSGLLLSRFMATFFGGEYKKIYIFTEDPNVVTFQKVQPHRDGTQQKFLAGPQSQSTSGFQKAQPMKLAQRRGFLGPRG